MPDPEVARLTAEWLRYAREDLAAARAGLAERSHRMPRHVCFDAQQAAEKALKARYVARQVQHPFVHDLEELAAGLSDATASDDLGWLSQWAVKPRYPFDETPTWEDAERAVAIARRVVRDPSEGFA